MEDSKSWLSYYRQVRGRIDMDGSSWARDNLMVTPLFALAVLIPPIVWFHIDPDWPTIIAILWVYGIGIAAFVLVSFARAPWKLDRARVQEIATLQEELRIKPALDDPQIYVDIIDGLKGKARMTPLSLTNRGRSIARMISIDSLSLGGRVVHFEETDFLAPNTSKEIIPKIDNTSPLFQYDLFNVLSDVANSEDHGMDDDYCADLRLRYHDYTLQKGFEQNVRIVFHPKNFRMFEDRPDLRDIKPLVNFQHEQVRLLDSKNLDQSQVRASRE